MSLLVTEVKHSNVSLSAGSSLSSFPGSDFLEPVPTPANPIPNTQLHRLHLQPPIHAIQHARGGQ